jgi:hypothetical protein
VAAWLRWLLSWQFHRAAGGRLGLFERRREMAYWLIVLRPGYDSQPGKHPSQYRPLKGGITSFMIVIPK